MDDISTKSDCAHRCENHPPGCEEDPSCVEDEDLSCVHRCCSSAQRAGFGGEPNPAPLRTYSPLERMRRKAALQTRTPETGAPERFALKADGLTPREQLAARLACVAACGLRGWPRTPSFWPAGPA